VQLRGELWRAEVVKGGGPVEAGDEVTVEAVDGLTLRVRLATEGSVSLWISSSMIWSAFSIPIGVAPAPRWPPAVLGKQAADMHRAGAVEDAVTDGGDDELFVRPPGDPEPNVRFGIVGIDQETVSCRHRLRVADVGHQNSAHQP
jgi:hypothetical protein